MPPDKDDLFEHFHAIMHLFKDRMRHALDSEGGGLGPTEARALGYFARHPGCTQQDLVQQSGRDKAQITRIVQQLMERGLLAREADPADRRRFNLQLTDKGLQIEQAMQAQRKALLASMLGALDHTEQAQLISLLQRMRRGAEQNKL
ncbi:MarR family winged helix-turn-helix transcriptional regulator [Uliginosibacterium sediminicola]|uniref:MarR family transcriptional regulator n=1 Tax=Uliginosibacterium sediminicola TaxID=2024550 RepID=A0ABU9YY69_9RHOO